MDPGVKRVQKESWQVRSVLMGERSGRANFVQNRMCGRGGVTDAVKMTSWQGSVGSTGRPVAARSGEWSTGSTTSSGEEDRKTRSLEAENKELRARIDALEKKGGKECKEGRVSLPGKKETWKMCGERTWTSRMRPRAVKEWMSKRKTAEGVYEMWKNVACLQISTGEYQRVLAAQAARGGEKEA